MRAILIQQGLADALKKDDESADTKKEKGQTDILEKAMSAIILCLGDKPLREVAKESSAAAIWLKLENLYMTKSLANQLYLKQRLYSFKIGDEKNMSAQIEEHVKILDDLENIEIKMEDKTLILLSALPRAYEISGTQCCMEGNKQSPWRKYNLPFDLRNCKRRSNRIKSTKVTALL